MLQITSKFLFYLTLLFTFPMRGLNNLKSKKIQIHLRIEPGQINLGTLEL